METKTVEIRDDGTIIAALAVRLDPGCAADLFLLERSGYGSTPESQSKYVMLWPMDGGEGFACSDPVKHAGHRKAFTDDRTLPEAHRWLREHFDEIDSGAVVDVEFILGERDTPKVSERLRRRGADMSDAAAEARPR